MEKINGIIEKITYHNEDNGFGIVRLQLDFRDHRLSKYKSKILNEFITVTCTFSRKPLLHEKYVFSGEFITNQYGLQFKASQYEIEGKDTLEGVVTYLSSDFFRGIGTKIATKVFETLGPECLKLIEENKENLDQVEGLTSAQKDTIYNGIIDNEVNNKAILDLLNLGLTMDLSLKLVNQYGRETLEIIKENPYKLISEVNGIGFVKADNIAIKLGISKNSPLRIKELLMYILMQLSYSNGDCFINKEELFLHCNEVLVDEEIPHEQLEKYLITLASENRVFIDNDNDVYEYSLYQAENNICKALHNLLDYRGDDVFDEEKIINRLELIQKNSNIEYNPKQYEAIKKSMIEPVLIITGGPGTGKSTIVKAIINLYAELYGTDLAFEEIKLLAPTGRAAKRLTEVTNHPAMTIHKFLGYEGHGVFQYGYGVSIPCKMVIVDEFSMVDASLCARLLSALEDNTRLVIVGDSDQLPSVGPGNVLNDLIKSKEITTVYLSKIHRQTENSSIIDLAFSVNEGEAPTNLMEKQSDRNFIKVSDNKISDVIIATIKQGLNKNMDLINDIQVLIPMYKGDLGINNINKLLQNELNPKEDFEYPHLGRVFRLNDKVLQLVNRSEKKVMNGDVGYISYIDHDGDNFNYLIVTYDFGDVTYQKNELEDLTHAYCMSVHKAQGSEYSLVVMPFSFKYYRMLKKKIIYTGITRAKKYLIMVGDEKAFCTGIKSLDEVRKTKLSQKLQNLSNNKKIDDSLSPFDEVSENSQNLTPYDFLD